MTSLDDIREKAEAAIEQAKPFVEGAVNASAKFAEKADEWASTERPGLDGAVEGAGDHSDHCPRRILLPHDAHADHRGYDTKAIGGFGALGEYKPSQPDKLKYQHLLFAMPNAWQNETTKDPKCGGVAGIYWWTGFDTPDNVRSSSLEG